MTIVATLYFTAAVVAEWDLEEGKGGGQNRASLSQRRSIPGAK